MVGSRAKRQKVLAIGTRPCAYLFLASWTNSKRLCNANRTCQIFRVRDLLQPDHIARSDFHDRLPRIESIRSRR